MTVEQLHKKFDGAQAADTPFEYTCIWEGCPCVRHTELGYCYLITEQEAKEYTQMFGEDDFYEVEREDGSELSQYYQYYFLEFEESFFAVRRQGT